MSSISAISLSGMTAAQSALDADGRNLANLQTRNHRRQLPQPVAEPDGGVEALTDTAAEPGEDETADMVGLLQSKNAFLANLAVFRAGNRMTGSLLDAVA